VLRNLSRCQRLVININEKLTPSADSDALRDLLLTVVTDNSLSSSVSEADTLEKDSPLAALLATLVRSPSRTKEGLDE
jgi:hypothetical protein